MENSHLRAVHDYLAAILAPLISGGGLNKAYKKIGILDCMGSGNLGDATIQEAMIQNIRKYCPDAQICGFSQIEGY